MQRDAISIPDTRPFLLEKFFSICHPHLRPVTDRQNVIIFLPFLYFVHKCLQSFSYFDSFLNIAAKERTEHFSSLETYGEEGLEDAVHVLKTGLAPTVLSLSPQEQK